MKPKHIISFLASLMIITACQDKKKEEAVSAVKEWMGRRFFFRRTASSPSEVQIPSTLP